MKHPELSDADVVAEWQYRVRTYTKRRRVGRWLAAGVLTLMALLFGISLLVHGRPTCFSSVRCCSA